MFSAKLKTFIKIFLIGCAGLVIGVSGMMIYKKQSSPIRSIASIEGYKPSRLILGKQTALMSVEIVGPQVSASNSKEIVELVGFITQHYESDTWIDYNWSLPEGVELVQGQLTGSIQIQNVGEPQQITILVRGFSLKRQKMVVLSSQMASSGMTFNASANIVSRPEDTTESRVMNINRRVRLDNNKTEMPKIAR